LGQLQKDLTEIEAAGIQLVGISYDSVETLKKYSDKNAIQYFLLSDEGSKTINAYEIHNQEGYPHPGTFLVDKTGTIRAKLFNDGYRRRHSTADLIEAAKMIE